LKIRERKNDFRDAKNLDHQRTDPWGGDEETAYFWTNSGDLWMTVVNQMGMEMLLADVTKHFHISQYSQETRIFSPQYSSRCWWLAGTAIPGFSVAGTSPHF
jgi:hypothetical protein